MARSSYVYVVIDNAAGPEIGDYEPAAGFTVKHELVTWLKRQADADLRWMSVWRLHDGTWQDKPPVQMDLEELLNA